MLLVSDCMSPFRSSLSSLPTSESVVLGSADLRGIAFLHQPLFVVRLTQDHVVLQEEFVPHAKPEKK